MLLTIALTFISPAPIALDDEPPRWERLMQESDYEALVDVYEDAYTAWRKELKEADGLKERRAVREREPAKLFRPRFEELADAGSGRALVWLIENARKIEERKQIPAFKEELYGRLFKAYLDAEWFDEVIAMYTRERRDVSPEAIEATMASALERSEGYARAQLLLGLARYRLAGKCNSGLELYEQLIKEHPDSGAAKVAQVEYDRLTKFGVGATPPDFKGQTIDGAELSLYANRGKVTVIDFWGYW